MKKIFFLLASFVLVFASCVDQKFDEPELTSATADFKANGTIADLKKLHTALGAFDKIANDLIVEGTVIADDATGNYYKTIVIQDATAGIDVKINAASLYNDFPIGSKVLIKCKDLTIGDYNGLYQLGGGTFIDANGNVALAGIEQALISTYIFKNGKGTITPRIVKLADLTNDMTSTLVQVDNMEFTKSTYTTFADGTKKLTVNRPINDCNGGTAFLRTSGFCSFANDATSEKNGTLIGVYSIFKADKQFYIRDPSDVRFDKNRCDGTSGGTGGTGGTSTELLSISDLRNSFTGTKTIVAANKFIKGVVISDAVNKNVLDKNCVVQDASGKGIIVRFAAAHPYLLGDAVEIDVAGQELSEFNGTLQVNNVPLAKAKTTGKGTLPTPKKLTLAQVLADIESVESTLVLIENCSHSATVYGGNVVLDDKTGKITLYTSNSATLTATFAKEVPVSNVLNVVGIIGQYTTATASTNQIQMRNISDATKGIGGGGTGGGPTTIVSIGSIRSEFTGTLTKISTGKSIKGIVITDKDAKNLSALNLVIQGDDGKGLVVRFAGNHTFALGESIEINVGDQELSDYNGLLQLNKIPLANATSKGAGTLPAPKVMTIADYVTNFENVESTIVQIKNATVTGGKYFDAARGTTTSSKGTLKVTDSTGSIDMYTVTTATFAGDTPPATSVSVTGVASEFTAAAATAKGVQILIRNASDVK